MTDREQVEALAYALMSQQQCDEDGVMCIVSRKAATEAADTLRALLRDRDAAEALAYERAAECADAQAWAPSKEYSDDEAEHIADLIRALATSPNALAEHDAKVRAEERERCAKIAMKTEPLDADFTGVWTDYEHGADEAQKAIAAAIREQAND